MKKRILAALLCAAMVVSVCACGNAGNDTEQNTEKTPATPPTLTSLAAFDDLKEVLKGDYAVTDEAIANYFTSMLCEQDAGLIEVKDRDTVQAGDIVQVDYTGYLNDKAFDGGSADNQIIDVSGNCAFNEATGATGNTYIEKFSEGLIGAKVKTPVKHNVTFPTNYSNTDLAGKETTFEFNVDKIYIKATPETVTDEYIAEHLGDEGYTTVDALVKYSTEELVTSMVMGYVIDKSKVDISEEYLNERLAAYEALIAETSGSTDISTIIYYSYGMTLEQIRPYWLQWIKSQVTAEVVFAEIIKSKNLTTDEKELEEFVEEVLDANSSFKSEEDVYNAVSYGNPEVGRVYIMNEFAVKQYILEQYRASQAVTE
ncbi:MAG: FKBP-type peptidyl-prolyl cis-trans isomerase [Agathobacter sp.]|nr:FKBP-type peptidyl-prolyl cis-trans isomerase [Agathobacter sp.]